MDEQLTDGVTFRRVIASVLDGLILGLGMLAVKLALWVLGFLTLGFGWFLMSGLWVLPIAYVVAFVASPGQATPGQMMMDLAVMRDDDLGRPTPAQALVYAGGFALTMALGAIWLAAAFFTRRARCLHDVAAGVAVLRASARPSLTQFGMAGGSFGR